MIGRDDLMSDKKFNIEELEKQCLEAEEKFKTLHEQLTKAKEDEAKAQRKKLEAEKDARYKEVIDAYANFEELRSNYVNDYGCFTFKTTNLNQDGSHSWFWNTVGLL